MPDVLDVPDENSKNLRALIVLPERTDEPEVRAWGLHPLERLKRGLARIGASQVEALESDLPAPTEAPGAADADWIVLRADLFYDGRLLDGLCDTSNVLLYDAIPGSDLGIGGARQFAPGSPGQSMLLERMLLLDGNRMPPVASTVVDTEATDVITSWINSVVSCP